MVSAKFLTKKKHRKCKGEITSTESQTKTRVKEMSM